MKTQVRYIQSSVIALALTFLTFVGMSFLISNNSAKPVTTVEFADFSKVRDMQQPNVKTDRAKEILPERKEIKQPPAAPELDVTQDSNPTRDAIPQGVSKSDLTKIDSTMTKIGTRIGSGLHLDQGLMVVAIIQPSYPIKAVQNKIEGYATVEFVVSETGKVINAKVIDSYPSKVFNRAAITAMLKSKFKPFIMDGKAQKVTAVQTFEFKLDQTQ